MKHRMHNTAETQTTNWCEGKFVYYALWTSERRFVWPLCFPLPSAESARRKISGPYRAGKFLCLGAADSAKYRARILSANTWFWGRVDGLRFCVAAWSLDIIRDVPAIWFLHGCNELFIAFFVGDNQNQSFCLGIFDSDSELVPYVLMSLCVFVNLHEWKMTLTCSPTTASCNYCS